MSIFTKIFVVLVMLLSVVLVALVVPFVVNSDTYKTAYMQEKALRVTAQKAADNREKDIALALAGLQESVSNLQAEKATLQAQIGDKDAQIQNQNAEIVRISALNSGYETNVARLSTSLDQYSKINDMLEAEVVERREKQLDAEKKLIETNAALRNSKVEAETLEGQVRLLKEQVDDLASTNEELAAMANSAGTPSADGDTRTITPAEPIRGSVTDARQLGDTLYVSLSVGSNDKVAEGMAFLLHSGDTYLGDAIVEKVDLNGSVARVTLKAGDIAAGATAVAGGL